MRNRSDREREAPEVKRTLTAHPESKFGIDINGETIWIHVGHAYVGDDACQVFYVPHSYGLAGLEALAAYPSAVAGYSRWKHPTLMEVFEEEGRRIGEKTRRATAYDLRERLTSYFRADDIRLMSEFAQEEGLNLEEWLAQEDA